MTITQKLFSHGNIRKNYTLSDSIDSQLSMVTWINTKFDIKMPETCDHVIGSFNIFKLLCVANQSMKALKRVKNLLFWYLFNLLSLFNLVSLIIIKSVT